LEVEKVGIPDNIVYALVYGSSRLFVCKQGACCDRCLGSYALPCPDLVTIEETSPKRQPLPIVMAHIPGLVVPENAGSRNPDLVAHEEEWQAARRILQPLREHPQVSEAVAPACCVS